MRNRTANPLIKSPQWMQALLFFGWMPITLFALLVLVRVVASGWSAPTFGTAAAFAAWLITFVWIDVALPLPDWRVDTSAD